MHKPKRFPAIRLSLLLLAINQAHASQFDVAVSARSLISDNSKKTSVEEPLEERQDIYQLGVKGDYSNWLVAADVDYQVYAQKFDKKSQDDEEYADGRATIVFGKESDPLGLELAHSRRMLLQSPDDVALLENQQEREIISAQPTLRKRISGADWVYLSGRAESVRFLTENNNQDSKRNGASFGWNHAISKVSTLMLSAQHTDVSFDELPNSDYRLASANLAYAVKLRQLDYLIEVGYNESTPEFGEKQSSPAYNLSVGYDVGLHFFGASAGRQITDTSFGNGNLVSPGEIPGTDGFSPDMGQIDRHTLGLDFSSMALCARCTFSLGASVTDDDYLGRDETSRNRYYRSSFAYAFSNASRISLKADRVEYNQERNELKSKYTTDYLSVEYMYTFMNGFDIKLFSRREERKGEDPESDYKENIFGAGLGFVF